jgi:hypothetical protein
MKLDRITVDPASALGSLASEDFGLRSAAWWDCWPPARLRKVFSKHIPTWSQRTLARPWLTRPILPRNKPWNSPDEVSCVDDAEDR